MMACELDETGSKHLLQYKYCLVVMNSPFICWLMHHHNVWPKKMDQRFLYNTTIAYDVIPTTLGKQTLEDY
jgi:hypothetical protein